MVLFFVDLDAPLCSGLLPQLTVLAPVYMDLFKACGKPWITTIHPSGLSTLKKQTSAKVIWLTLTGPHLWELPGLLA